MGTKMAILEGALGSAAAYGAQALLRQDFAPIHLDPKTIASFNLNDPVTRYGWALFASAVSATFLINAFKDLNDNVHKKAKMKLDIASTSTLAAAYTGVSTTIMSSAISGLFHRNADAVTIIGSVVMGGVCAAYVTLKVRDVFKMHGRAMEMARYSLHKIEDAP